MAEERKATHLLHDIFQGHWLNTKEAHSIPQKERDSFGKTAALLLTPLQSCLFLTRCRLRTRFGPWIETTE